MGEDDWQRVRGAGHDALMGLLDGDGSRTPAEFHLFESTLQLFVHVCRDRPLVVLLEDLQWADPASLTLVDFLHRHGVHLPMLVVGTYRADEVGRPDHPHHDAIADLAQKALTIPLTGLDNEGISQLRQAFGASTSTAEAENLRRLTGGNPFFVIESVAFTDPTESLGVRRAVDRRVDDLGDVEHQVMTIAALIGREAPDALLTTVAGEGADAALGAIEASGLMRRQDRQHVFVHDLVRDALLDRLSLEERRSLQARIVRASLTSELDAALLPAQLAWLATQAVPDIPADAAVTLLEAAAVDASARLTHEAAGRHFEEAASLAADGEVRARLTLESGHAYRRAGALSLARARYASLVDDAPVETRARALLGLHWIGDPAAVGEPSEVVRQLDEVDAQLRGTVDTSLRAEVLAARSRSWAHLLAEDRTAAAPMAAEALELARAGGDETTVASCLLAYHDAIWEPGTEEERLELAGELTRAGRRLGDPSVEAQGLLLRMVAELESGDPHYLATHRQFDAVAEASRSQRLQFVAASRRGTVAALRADLPRAVTEIDAARALGERIGEPDALGVWCDQRWHVARQAGDHETVAELLAILRETGDPHWMVYDAMVAADLGDGERATRLAPQIADLGARWPRWAARLWDVFEAHLAVLGGDEARIAELVARLEPDAPHWAVLAGGVLVQGPVALSLARLEAARDRWERALAWSRQAEASAEHLDAPMWLYEARADRLIAERALDTLDAEEVASTMSAARDRGLLPVVERLQPLLPATSPPLANVFRRDGDVWTLVFEGVEARMPDAKGLHDLHTLLANPGVDVAVSSLATDAFVSVDAPPVLDAQAKEAYRRRLDELDRQLDRVAVRGDAERSDVLEKERQALLDELRRAAGLGGRDRRLNSDQERLRKTVTARIRDLLRRLDDRHPALAAHLRDSVHTGSVCVYAPAAPTRWDLGS
jgi:hypothetical protein